MSASPASARRPDRPARRADLRTDRRAARRAARRPPRAARRLGYLIAVLLDVVLLYSLHVWPGWRQVSFLTDATPRVLGWVTASIAVGLVANLVYLVADPPALKAFGDLVITLVGLGAIVRVWQVFPFAFGPSALDWHLLVRVVLAVGIGGSVIGALVQLVALVRAGTKAPAR